MNLGAFIQSCRFYTRKKPNKWFSFIQLVRWSNSECERHNFNLLCQKTQDITFTKLTEIVFDLKKKYEKEKKELKDTIAEMQSVESDLKHRIEELEKNETILQENIEDMKTGETILKNDIEEMKDVEKDLKTTIRDLQKKESNCQKQIGDLMKSDEKINFDVLNLNISIIEVNEKGKELEKTYEKGKKEIISTLTKMQSFENELNASIEILKKSDVNINTEIAHLPSNQKSLINMIIDVKEKENKLNSSFTKMQDVESDLKTSINALEKVENEDKAEIRELKKDITTIQDKIKSDVLNSKFKIYKMYMYMQSFNAGINCVLNSLIVLTGAPTNTVYVQYPFELEPAKVWNCSKGGQWKDISNQYEGLFFRVSGGNATNWGAIQTESAPYLWLVRQWTCGSIGSGCSSKYQDVIVPFHGTASPVKVSVSSDFELWFYNSGYEVRPRNMAIKIWKCVA